METSAKLLVLILSVSEKSILIENDCCVFFEINEIHQEEKSSYVSRFILCFYDIGYFIEFLYNGS